MAAKRSVSLLIAATTAVALAAPALADPVSFPPVEVTVLGLGGTRDFAIEDLQGQTLQAIALGTGGGQPFRVHVTDKGYLPTTAVGDYDVYATLSNLYLQTGDAFNAGDFNYTVKVPSSDVSIGFGSNPLSVADLSVVALPRLSLSGALNSCASLSGSLKTALGLHETLGTVLGSNTALSDLCETLGTTGTPIPAGQLTVDGALRNLTSSISNLAKLPTVISGATGGTFTHPSFADGVGAFDTAGAAAATHDATTVPLMSGATGEALDPGFAQALLTQLDALVTGPLTTATGVGAQTQLAAVVSQLSASSVPVLSQLGAVLNGLDNADRSTLINSIFTTFEPMLPTLADLQGITGSSYAFPVLSARPQTPMPGRYGGTMTVTYVQS